MTPDDVCRFTDEELTALRPLQRQFPTLDAALGEIARRSAELTSPMGTIHVISDIHGEDKKLRHVINNASGTLRPLVQGLFASRMGAEEFREFLTLIFYPAEMVERLERDIDRYMERVDLPPKFVIPGGGELSARLDVARSAVRRAERRVSTLDLDDSTVLKYLNRLSDALFAMARFADEPDPEMFEGRA